MGTCLDALLGKDPSALQAQDRRTLISNLTEGRTQIYIWF